MWHPSGLLLSQQHCKRCWGHSEQLVSKILSMKLVSRSNQAYLTWAWIWDRNRGDWMLTVNRFEFWVWYQTHQVKICRTLLCLWSYKASSEEPLVEQHSHIPLHQTWELKKHTCRTRYSHLFFSLGVSVPILVYLHHIPPPYLFVFTSTPYPYIYGSPYFLVFSFTHGYYPFSPFCWSYLWETSVLSL